ncbi:MAG: hypothetical protein HKO92_07530 [Flavobacteriaceae bacterium]|nr:hypothetical protein [Flavobacteriaceae bacterium]
MFFSSASTRRMEVISFFLISAIIFPILTVSSK